MISSIVIVTLSPGITILTPSANATVPVTSIYSKSDGVVGWAAAGLLGRKLALERHLDDGEARQLGVSFGTRASIKLGTLEGCTGNDVRSGSLSSRLSRAISDEGLEETCDMFAMSR